MSASRYPITTEMLEQTRLGRALAAGQLIATVRSKRTGQHITIALRAKAKPGAKWMEMPYPLASHVFIDVPNSGDGGFNDKVGTLYPPHSGARWAGSLYPDSSADPARVWTAKLILEVCVGQQPMENEKWEVLPSTFCFRCGRELTEPASIEAGFGPTCLGRVEAEYGKRHQAKVKAAPVSTPVPPLPPASEVLPEPPAPGTIEIEAIPDFAKAMESIA